VTAPSKPVSAAQVAAPPATAPKAAVTAPSQPVPHESAVTLTAKKRDVPSPPARGLAGAVPAAVVPPKTPAPPKSNHPDITAAVAEVRYLLAQGLNDDARAAYDGLAAEHEGHPQLVELGVALGVHPPPAATPPEPEPEPEAASAPSKPVSATAPAAVVVPPAAAVADEPPVTPVAAEPPATAAAPKLPAAAAAPKLPAEDEDDDADLGAAIDAVIEDAFGFEDDTFDGDEIVAPTSDVPDGVAPVLASESAVPRPAKAAGPALGALSSKGKAREASVAPSPAPTPAPTPADEQAPPSPGKSEAREPAAPAVVEANLGTIPPPEDGSAAPGPAPYGDYEPATLVDQLVDPDENADRTLANGSALELNEPVPADATTGGSPSADEIDEIEIELSDELEVDTSDAFESTTTLVPAGQLPGRPQAARSETHEYTVDQTVITKAPAAPAPFQAQRDPSGPKPALRSMGDVVIDLDGTQISGKSAAAGADMGTTLVPGDPTKPAAPKPYAAAPSQTLPGDAPRHTLGVQQTPRVVTGSVPLYSVEADVTPAPAVPAVLDAAPSAPPPRRPPSTSQRAVPTDPDAAQAIASSQAVRVVMLGPRGEAVAERTIMPGEALAIGSQGGDPWSDDRHMDAQHARLAPAADGVLVSAIGPSGVFAQVSERTRVRNGDQFKVGQSSLQYEHVAGGNSTGTWGDLIVTLREGQPPRVFPISGAGLNLGREDGDVTFDGDTYVSADHCRFVCEGNHLWIEDLGSSNGTYVRVREGEPVKFGTLLLAGHTQFKIRQG